jgi:hypothetical protein
VRNEEDEHDLDSVRNEEEEHDLEDGRHWRRRTRFGGSEERMKSKHQRGFRLIFRVLEYRGKVKEWVSE